MAVNQPIEASAPLIPTKVTIAMSSFTHGLEKPV